jgi:hypothetical protein
MGYTVQEKGIQINLIKKAPVGLIVVSFNHRNRMPLDKQNIFDIADPETRR